MIVLGKQTHYNENGVDKKIDDAFAVSLANELEVGYFPIYHKVFSGGESYFRFDNKEPLKSAVKGGKEDLLLVLRGEAPEFNSDRLFIQSKLLLDKLKTEYNVPRVFAVIPYMGYGKQDKKFLSGEVVSLRVFREMLKEYCELVFNVSLHDFRKKGFVEQRVYNVDGNEAVIDFLKTLELENPYILAPDLTANERVISTAEALDAGSNVVIKRRDFENGQLKLKVHLPNLSDHELVLNDDLVLTAGTMCESIKKAKKEDPKRTICIAPHGPFCYLNEERTRSSLDLLNDAGAETYVSDSIDTPVSKFSVVPQTANAIREKI